MVTWLKSWEEGLLTHIDSSDGSHEYRRGPVKERRGPMKMEGDQSKWKGTHEGQDGIREDGRGL